MKQMNLFDDCIPPAHEVKKGAITWKLFIDGASRKNPGIAGAGIYLLKEQKQVFKKGFFLGIKTNNQAEYLALLLGVYYAKKNIGRNDTLFVFSDSELMVKHLQGIYKIRSIELKQLFDLAFLLLDGLNYSMCHILREFNGIADELANEGIDKKVKIPEEFITLLKAHDITL